MAQQSPFAIAASQIGLDEHTQAAAIQDFLKTGGANLDPQTAAWCAAFINSSLGQAGIQGTGSNMARSFMDWGQATDAPQPGDIAVFSRGDPNGPYGHVGFYAGENPDGTVRILGGNQGDSVGIRNYTTDRLLGYRTAVDQGVKQGNALSQPQTPPPQNMLPQFQIAATDPAAFMRQRNALAPQPLQAMQRNSLGRL